MTHTVQLLRITQTAYDELVKCLHLCGDEGQYRILSGKHLNMDGLHLQVHTGLEDQFPPDEPKPLDPHPRDPHPRDPRFKLHNYVNGICKTCGLAASPTPAEFHKVEIAPFYCRGYKTDKYGKMEPTF